MRLGRPIPVDQLELGHEYLFWHVARPLHQTAFQYVAPRTHTAPMRGYLIHITDRDRWDGMAAQPEHLGPYFMSLYRYREVLE